MAINKTLVVFIGIDIVFLACAGVLIALPLVAQKAMSAEPNMNSIVQLLLLNNSPLTAIMVNGVFMTIAFAVSFPAMFLKENRFLISTHAWLVWLCATITLCVGLSVWFLTLRTTANLAPIYSQQEPAVISMLQRKFTCCGFRDPTRFIVDATCPNAADAARHGLCAPRLSAFANQFLSEGFTAMFGICALDGFLIVAALCVLKDRAEKARYRLIDEKRGYRG